MKDIMSGFLMSSLKMISEKNPGLCHKVCELYGKTTKWKRTLNETETRLLIEFINDNMNETDPTKFKYGQTG